MDTEYSQIYVGDLEPEIDEKMLYAHCMKVFPKAEIYSIRVVRDWATYASLHYAYVNLNKSEDAVKFISLMNHSVIVKNELRVTWKSSSSDRIPEANLFVNKLNVATTVQKVDQIFEKYGPILSSKVVPFKDVAKAYVQLKTVENASAAIHDLNGQMVDGNVISVAIFMKKAERRSKYTNLYVKNFPEGTTIEKLAEVFSRFGKVTSTYIGVDAEQKPKVKVNDDGSRTLYGFVNFETHEQAVQAQSELNGSIFPGTADMCIDVACALKKDERKRQLNEQSGDSCLYIGSIPKDLTKDDLLAPFSKQGKVTFLNYPERIGKNGFRFAYCYFATREEADRARNALNGTTIRGTNIRVDFYKTKQQIQAENDIRKRQIPNNNFFFSQFGQPSNFPQQQAYRNPKKKNMQRPRNERRYPAAGVAPAQAMVQAVPASVPAQQIRTTAKIEPLTAAELANMSDDDKHEAFGERIYNYMSEVHPDNYAGKITGMVLETFKGNFVHLNNIIADGTIINKIDEAIAVYKDHEKQDSAVSR